MNYLDLPKPHGFLIWRGKQTAIASDRPLPTEQLLLVSDGQAFGEVVLSNPVAVDLKGFEDLAEKHCIRPEERKIYWPEAKAFFVHWLKSWQPFEESKAIKLDNGQAEFVESLPLTETQRALLLQAQRLPKTLVLSPDAITLEAGKAVIQNGLDTEKIEPVLKAVFDGLPDDPLPLPLYQLALVRNPNLMFSEKKSEATMPYKVVKNHEGCKDGEPFGVVNKKTGKLEGCSESMEMAQESMAAMMASEGKSLEGKKCREDMPMHYVPYGVTTFADLEAAEMAQETMHETAELTGQFQQLAANILSMPDIADKPAALSALAKEYVAKVQMTMGAKELESEKEGMDLPGEKALEEGEKVGKRMKTSMMEKLKAAWETIKELMDWAEPMDDDEMDMSKGFAIKQVNGKPWFFAYSTNAFMDREQEIFSTKSLEKYVEEAEQKQDRGYFNFWHIKTQAQPDLTDFAKKEWQGVVGRFLVEAGPFLDNEKGQAALEYFTQNPDDDADIAPEGWGCSPEYRYLPEERKSGTYENIWITRTSVLPRLAAANIWTKGSVIMALSEQQKQAAEKIFGKELAAQIIKPAEDATKELEEAGVAHKGDTETPQEEAKPSSEFQVVLDALQQMDLPGLSKTISDLAEGQNQLNARLDDLASQVKSLEKTEALKQKTEMPRFAWSLMNRAIESEKTVVTEDDPLKNMKPAETKPVVQDNSIAGQIFPQRR